MTAASLGTDKSDAPYFLTPWGNERTRDSMGANSNWQLAIGLCISSQESIQQSAFSTQLNHLPQRTRRTPRKKKFWIPDPFAIFASVAVKFLWLIAEC
jgi:hypothetical protein